MAQFGTVFCDHFAIAHFTDGAWQEAAIEPLAPLTLHPASHVFHYASTCFEGFKAYRWDDGKARIFRLDDHVARMQKSAASLCMPVPDADLLAGMVTDVVANNVDDIPAPPGALYLRPTLIGTLQNIGAAAAPSTEATLFVLTSPVGDYFEGGARPLKLLVDDQRARTTEHLGSTKTGGNYAAALGPTLDAKEKYGVDQVLFCPDGDVQETGAANFLLISDDEIITKPLDASFLHGMTRDSILRLGADLGYKVSERNFTVAELLLAASTHEAALSGTAACLSPVGCLVYNGEEISMIDGNPGPNVEKLRKALQDIQYGNAPDTHNWLTEIG
ncbi:MAG: branched-chain amino acid aminotransferase [Gammaproteobacteria bacterium]|nr:branched-chain amino acid aminotransferase [Gammaproteobacteria bacterium]MDH3750617.1 branched-chain amino acid aminotransferase [Gammaproteobacteria bacterium]MDH3804722.1 branched-chain amino acid aminotransferase [Gammaproteobacteria bacterium]